jgi:hypothetical protein
MIERWSRGGCPQAARARSMRTRPLDTRTPCRSTWDGLGDGVLRAAIPRKEVIQPHLPVRLPCYDFTPVTRLTLDTGAPCGFA